MRNYNPEPTVFIELFKVYSFRNILTSLLQQKPLSLAPNYFLPLEFLRHKIDQGFPSKKDIRNYGKVQAWKMYLFPEWFVNNEGQMEEISDDLKIRFGRLNDNTPSSEMIRHYGLEQAMQRILFPEQYYS